jgi:putative ABC transport system permease protein
MQHKPPQLAQRFLRWFLRDELAEEVQGDLEEQYEAIREKTSPFKAKLHYWYQVCNYLRPFAVKRINSLNSNYSTMFRHNFILTFRNFKRHSSSFFINLIGLSTGLACALLIFLWVNDELQVDKFHEKDARLYLVLSNQQTAEGMDTWPATPAMLGESLSAEMPEVEYATSTSNLMDNFTISIENNHFKSSAWFADKNFFKVFSYSLLQGDESQVLADKNSVVLSENMARKLFHTSENAVGKTVEWQVYNIKKQATVSGVYQDLPTSASQKFDFALSYEVYKDILGDGAHWGNFNAYTYLVLKKGTNLPQFNAKVEHFITTKQEDSDDTIFLQKYSDGYLYNHFENGVQAGGRIEYVRLFSVIAVFILIIACINFMNLSTARATRRMKEVGIKKAVGARRSSLIFQFMEESVMMAFLALSVAVLLVALFLPQFNTITGKQLSLQMDTNFVFPFLGITLFAGLLAGSYPALYLSRFNPVAVLKGKLNSSFSELLIRKGLVIFQFTLSVILIVSVVVVYQQMKLIQTKNLGFNRENIIYFSIDGKVSEDPETFLSEIKRIPGVSNASSMWGSMVGNFGATFGHFDWEGKDPDEIYQFFHLGVNYDMLQLLGVEMEEGRHFSRDYSGDTAKIIFNEAAIEVMGLKDPVGKVFNLWGNNFEIIGVTKNFNFESLHENVKPFFFRLVPKDAEKVLVKIEPGRERETIEKIQDFYATVNPGYTFDYQFLDDEYQALYAAEQRVSSLSRYFAGVAILISCLGLFGLAAFTAQRRLKEIGIRKILGSTEVGIVYLLTSDFTKMVGIAILIALPVSYFTATQWLEGFAYRIDLDWWYFAGAGLTALLIAWFTVGLQTVKAARINPTECLKDE